MRETPKGKQTEQWINNTLHFCNIWHNTLKYQSYVRSYNVKQEHYFFSYKQQKILTSESPDKDDLEHLQGSRNWIDSVNCDKYLIDEYFFPRVYLLQYALRGGIIF